jgi:type I restriction enzyme M protein
MDAALSDFAKAVADYDAVASRDVLAVIKSKVVVLGDEALFRLFIGKRVLTRETSADSANVPVYSANVSEPMGYVEEKLYMQRVINVPHPIVLWGIDGNFEFNIIPANTKFITTDHCGAIEILDKTISADFVLNALHKSRYEESFGRGFRASLANMRKFPVTIPVTDAGTFDVRAQRSAAEKFAALERKREALATIKAKLDALFMDYAGQSNERRRSR